MGLYLADAAPAATAPPTPLDQEVSGFMLKLGTAKPSSTQVANFLQLYPAGADRDAAARALITAGVDSDVVATALNGLSAMDSWNWKAIGGVLTLASAAVSGFHGYRRNKSITWGLIWFALGGIFPIVTPVIAAAQGFAKPKGA